MLCVEVEATAERLLLYKVCRKLGVQAGVEGSTVQNRSRSNSGGGCFDANVPPLSDTYRECTFVIHLLIRLMGLGIALSSIGMDCASKVKTNLLIS